MKIEPKLCAKLTVFCAICYQAISLFSSLASPLVWFLFRFAKPKQQSARSQRIHFCLRAFCRGEPSELRKEDRRSAIMPRASSSNQTPCSKLVWGREQTHYSSPEQPWCSSLVHFCQIVIGRGSSSAADRFAKHARGFCTNLQHARRNHTHAQITCCAFSLLPCQKSANLPILHSRSLKLVIEKTIS